MILYFMLQMRTQAQDTEVILARDPRQIALQQQTRAAQRLQIRAARAGNQEATCERLSSAPPTAPGPLAPQAPMPRLHLGRMGPIHLQRTAARTSAGRRQLDAATRCARVQNMRSGRTQSTHVACSAKCHGMPEGSKSPKV